MVDKNTVVIAVCLSVILSTALSYGVIMTVPQVQDALRGSTGPQGETGLVGPQGESGESIVGPQGETGPQGIQGEQGIQGKSYSFDGEWIDLYNYSSYWPDIENAIFEDTKTIEISSDIWRISWQVRAFPEANGHFYFIIKQPDTFWNVDLYRVKDLGAGKWQDADTLYMFGKGTYIIKAHFSDLDYIWFEVNELIPNKEE